MRTRPGYPGVAFTTAADGDMRGSADDRAAASSRFGVSAHWATVDQVHGARVVLATKAGNHGSADALFTTEVGLPIAVFTADCFGVALIADGAVGVAHAGWRGVVAGIVPALVEAMKQADRPPAQAAIGPGIGPCCYEVGPEVSAVLQGGADRTTWGSASVDLARVIRAQIPNLDIWETDECTRCSTGFHSHRENATTARMATVAWTE